MLSVAGDVGFDDREILRDVSHMDDSLYKSPEPPSIQLGDKDDKSLESSLEKPMDVDLPPPVMDDGFGGAVDDGFVGECVLYSYFQETKSMYKT